MFFTQPAVTGVRNLLFLGSSCSYLLLAQQPMADHTLLILMAVAHSDITLVFTGNGLDEIGKVQDIEGDAAPGLKVSDVIVRADPRNFRPTEVETLLGDPTKARERLGWVPEITVAEMCAEMIAADLAVARRHALLRAHGFETQVAGEN